MNNKKLIQIAASVINPKQLKDGLIGDVGCALLGDNGKIYTGVCVGVNTTGICAERVAAAKMITDDKKYVIRKIVAVWKDKNKDIFVISPCGSCLQFIKEMDKNNTESEIILDIDKTIKLKNMLPCYDWWQKIVQKK